MHSIQTWLLIFVFTLGLFVSDVVAQFSTPDHFDIAADLVVMTIAVVILSVPSDPEDPDGHA